MRMFDIATATLFAVLTLSACASPRSSTSSPTPNYRVSKVVSVDTPDRWDSVIFEPTSKRVYLAHGDRVTVLNGQDGKIVGNVEGFDGGTHGVAISTSTGRGYTDDGKAGIAASFDLATLKVRKRIKAEADADGITLDPRTGYVYVIDGASGKVTVIDPKSDKRIATIDVGGGLEFAAADDAGKLYINGAEKREIVRIDTGTNRIDARWSIPNCERPHGIALNEKGRRLFSSCANSLLVVVNLDNGATVATLPIGKGTDGAAFDPKRNLIFSSNGHDGTLSVIQEKDPQTFVALGEIKTAVSARTMAIDPETGRIYLAAADLDPKALGPNGRPLPIPGSLKLLMLDPSP
jgi:YVTN family beta-propeller protein